MASTSSSFLPPQSDSSRFTQIAPLEHLSALPCRIYPQKSLFIRQAGLLLTPFSGKCRDYIRYADLFAPVLG